MTEGIVPIEQVRAIRTDSDLVQVARHIRDYVAHVVQTHQSLDAIIDERRRLLAVETYMRQAIKDRDLKLQAQNDLADARLRQERYIGRWLAKGPKNSGTAGTGDANIGRATGGSTMLPPVDTTPTLADRGLDKFQSSRWQLEASLPEDIFEQHVAEVKAAGQELTSTGLQQLAARIQRQQTVLEMPKVEQALPDSPTQYRCLVVDPPWPIQKIERDVRPMQGQDLDYPVMSLDEIAGLPVYGSDCA